MLLINGSNREKNNYKILKELKQENDTLISLSHKKINYCLGCNSCKKKLENYCIQEDDMKDIYMKLKENDKIIISSPLYMSHITGLLKNMIDRCYPFYHHNYFQGKTVYLILTGQGSKEDNEEEIEAIKNYFKGISEWLYFEFKFLDYFSTGEKDNIEYDNSYEKRIKNIKEQIDER